MKPFIRWPGNKSKYLKYIIPYLPSSFSTYIEPFLGSGALLLYLQPKEWIANDLNRDIVNAWESVSKDPNYMLNKFRKIHKCFANMNNDERLAYCKRKTLAIPRLDYGLNRSTWFITMIFCSYLGHIIQRHKFHFGSIEPTLAKNKPLHIISLKYNNNLLSINKFLHKSEGKLFNTDYKQILKLAKKGDFIFLDPPYIEEHKYQFTYTPGQPHFATPLN